MAEVADDIRKEADGRVIGPGRTYEGELAGAVQATRGRLLSCVQADWDARARYELPVRAAEAIYRDHMPKDGASYSATWARDVAARIRAEAAGYDDLPDTGDGITRRIARAADEITRRLLAEGPGPAPRPENRPCS